MQIKKPILVILRYLSLRLYKSIQSIPTPPTAQLGETQAQAIPYHSLSPIDDANVGDYVEALKWALDNRKEKAIYNIALTGPYGSGKSSILKTFKKQNTNKDYVFLDISLATFKEELPEATTQVDGQEPEGRKADKSNDDILRLIELSILQQIFYHEEDEKIPDSRFKKIKTLNRKSLYYITAGLLSAVLFGFYLFFPVAFEKLLMVKIGEPTNKILHWVSLLGFCVALVTAAYRSVRILYGLRISKIKFQETEIEIDKGISKSILNNHLDEILYFFEVTPYSVVIIEDLDRFRQSEIFTKLRELNLLINNSKKLKGKQVVFIYAVRDEMFQDKDRTKFFDFIIPVIPVINSSNSKEKLSAIAIENNYEVSPELIDDVSLFIDDMRLLYNIMNEYAVYRRLLDKGLNRDKLLAILIYKNIWPDDFVLLGNNEGALYSLLTKKNEFIKTNLIEIDSKIKEHREAIDILQKTMLKNIYELRLLYVAKFASEVGSVSLFTINESDCELDNVASTENFEYFKQGKFKYYTYYLHSSPYYRQKLNVASLNFKDLERKVDPNYTYEQRLAAVEDVFNSKEEKLKGEIEALERQKQIIRHVKIKEILSKEPPKTDTNNKKEVLLHLLLRNGYINEDYQDYISLFYEGSLTRNDRSFVLNVKSQVSSEYDSPLNKIENVIKKFKPIEFNSPYLLNFSLLDHMLTNAGYDQHLNYLFEQLNDASDEGILFIDSYIASGVEINIFMKKLVHDWIGILDYVDGSSDFSQEKKDAYVLLILENADIEDLKRPKMMFKIAARIAKMRDFLNQFPEPRVKLLIEGVQPKFDYVNLHSSPKELVDLVISRNYYQIGIEMLKEVLSTTETFDLVEFEQRNYACVTTTSLNSVTRYLQTHFEAYINEVYLKLPANIYEQGKYLTELLNNKDIALAQRLRIANRIETVLSSLTEIEENAFDEILFDREKIEPTWENVILYFERHGDFDSVLTTFVNKMSVTQQLVEHPIPLGSSVVTLESCQKFMLALINRNTISDESYQILIKCVRYAYDMNQLVGIGRVKLAALINEREINFSQENLEVIRKSYSGLQHRYIELYKIDLFDQLDDFDLTVAEVSHILRSDEFDETQKQRILDWKGEDQIIESEEILRALYPLVMTNNPLTVSKAILIAMLQADENIASRIKLFNTYHRSFGPLDTVTIFEHFPSPFKKIGERHKSFTIEEMNEENRFLAINLKEREMISSYKIDAKGIKIVNFKWK